MSTTTQLERPAQTTVAPLDTVTFIRVQSVENLLENNPKDNTSTINNFSYVERFWLPLIGPTSLLLLRHVHRGFDDHPRGFRSSRRFLAKSLGIGAGLGQSAPLQRSLNRLHNFGLLKKLDDQIFEVDALIPLVEPFRVDKLPPRLQEEHDRWMREQSVAV